MLRFAARRRFLAAALALGLAGPTFAEEAKIADARPGAVRVLASTGLRAVLESVHADAERAVGRPVVIEFGSSRALQGAIESGPAFEVAIVTPEVLDAATAKGAVRAGSRKDVGQSMVAIGQRGGARGDISTPAGLKALFMGAKAIRFNPIGSGRPTLDRMSAGLGFDVPARTRPLPSPQDPPATLGPGEYELTIVLDSEVPSLAPGAVNLGPIPAPFQVPVVMAAGVGAKGDAQAAQAFMQFLQSPTVTRALAANRMTRIGG